MKTTVLVKVPIILDPLCDIDPQVEAARRLAAAIDLGMSKLELPPGWQEIRLDEAYGMIEIGPRPILK